MENDKSQRKETICLKKSTLAREEKMNVIQEKLEAGTKEIFTTEKYKTLDIFQGGARIKQCLN